MEEYEDWLERLGSAFDDVESALATALADPNNSQMQDAYNRACHHHAEVAKMAPRLKGG